MKRLIIFLTICYIFITAVFAQEPYVLVFKEDFNDDFNTAFIDPIYNYKYSHKWQRDGHNRFCISKPISQETALNCYSTNYVTASNGIANIKVDYTPGAQDYETVDDITYLWDFNYTSGILITRQAFKYGFFEVRAKMPPANEGFHSSIWIRNFTEGLNDEIDITETMAKTPNKIRGNLIYNGEDGDNAQEISIPSYIPGSFNKYQFLWTESEFFWSVNDIPLTYHLPLFTGIMDFDYHNYCCRHHLILDIEVDHNGYCGFFPSESAGVPWEGQFPATYSIDYVKIWKKAHPDTDYNFLNFQQAESDESCIIGRNITLGGLDGQAVIKADGEWYMDKQSLVLAAREKITLKEGFHAEYSSYFHAFTYEVIDYILKSRDNEENEKIGSVRYIDTVQMKNNHENNEDKILNVDKNGLTADLGWQVYPNPCKDKIHVSNSLENMFTVQIINLNGEVVLQKTDYSVNNEIDISDIPNGMYFVKIYTNHKVLSDKLIVAKE